MTGAKLPSLGGYCIKCCHIPPPPSILLTPGNRMPIGPPSNSLTLGDSDFILSDTPACDV